MASSVLPFWVVDSGCSDSDFAGEYDAQSTTGCAIFFVGPQKPTESPTAKPSRRRRNLVEQVLLMSIGDIPVLNIQLPKSFR